MEQQNKPLTLGSLFDGSGGFPLGGLLSGITPVWASEVEPFPIRVTTKRMPWLKHYGNVLELSRIVQSKKHPKFLIDYCAVCRLQSL